MICEISILVCHMFHLTFCFIFIPMQWPFKPFCWEVLIAFHCLLLIKWLQGHMIFCVFDSENKTIRISIIIFSTSWSQNTVFGSLSLNSTLQLINGIWSDLQKWLRYFNGKTIVLFLKIPFAVLDSPIKQCL